VGAVRAASNWDCVARGVGFNKIPIYIYKYSLTNAYVDIYKKI
jgi:hypothetical protein